MNWTPAWIAVATVSAAGLLANAFIMNRMGIEVDDKYVGPHLNPFERMLRRDRLRMIRMSSEVEQQHKKLYPQSRLRTIQTALNYCLLAIWVGSIGYTILSDR